MNIEELKLTIEKQTGIPSILLTGETAEENIAQAKAYIAYKREADAQRPKTAKEEFIGWLQMQTGDTPKQTEAEALASIEDTVRIEAGGYPIITDGGEVANAPDGKTTKEHFAEWIAPRTAFDPFKRADGWKNVF